MNVSSAPSRTTSHLPPAPKGIVGSQGEPLTGTYLGSPDRVDLSGLDSDYRKPLDRWIRDKEFTYTALSGVSDQGTRVKVIMAVTDLGYASSAFVSVFDLDKKKVLADHTFLGLPGEADISEQPVEGLQASYHGHFNNAHLSLSHPKGAEQYSQHIDIPARAGQPALAFDGVFGKGGPEPATLVTPMLRTGEETPSALAMTVKSQALPGSGVLNVGDQTFHLRELAASIDYTSGTLPRVTEWQWGSVTGKLSDGRPFGINMGVGFNDTDSRVNNNLLWVGDTTGGWSVTELPKLKFDYDVKRPLDPWSVTSDDPNVEVDLQFEPSVMHSEKRNLGLIGIDFDQPSGYWKGTITDHRSGQVYRFEKADGVAENQWVKW